MTPRLPQPRPRSLLGAILQTPQQLPYPSETARLVLRQQLGRRPNVIDRWQEVADLCFPLCFPGQVTKAQGAHDFCHQRLFLVFTQSHWITCAPLAWLAPSTLRHLPLCSAWSLNL